MHFVNTSEKPATSCPKRATKLRQKQVLKSKNLASVRIKLPSRRLLPMKRIEHAMLRPRDVLFYYARVIFFRKFKNIEAVEHCLVEKSTDYITLAIVCVDIKKNQTCAPKLKIPHFSRWSVSKLDVQQRPNSRSRNC